MGDRDDECDRCGATAATFDRAAQLRVARAEIDKLRAAIRAERERAIKNCIGALRVSREGCMCFEKNVRNLEALLAPPPAEKENTRE